MTSTEGSGSVIFVGHDASRTGAPILLASALRWATQQQAGPTDLRLLLLDGGPLIDDYRRSVPTRVLGRGASAPVARLGAAARSVGLPVQAGEGSHRWGLRPAGVDVVVANTLVSLPFSARVARRGTRLVCHVHELDGVADRVLPDGPRRTALVGRVDRFIAAGAPVAEMLVDRWGLASWKVVVVDEWIDVDERIESREHRRSVGPRPRVLAVGALRHRKGSARFVDLMSMLATHPSRPVGTWMGGAESSVEADELRSDIARSVHPDSLELVADRPDPGEVLASADVFVSTAIEDPYPLTVLEAAAAGVPVVGFDSGGIREVLHAVDQADALVPVDDVIGLARVVGRLLDDPEERARRGRRLSDWVRRTHSTAQLAPRWWEAVTG